MNVDFNKAECITYVTRWAHYEYHNVCTGAVRSIPWGFGEWIAASLGIGLVLCCIAGFMLLTGLDYHIYMYFKNRKK